MPNLRSRGVILNNHRFAVLALLFAVIIMSAFPLSAQEAPALEPADCMFDVPAGRNVECGYLTVPAARDADGNAIPEAGTMRLAVAVFHSPTAPDDATPVVYLEGGPGGDALENLLLTFDARFSPLLADRDMIFFDQRGTGYSEPALACPAFTEWSLEILGDDRPIEEIDAEAVERLIDCHDTLAAEGVDFTQYSSRESAQDLDDLRQALGYEEWNLFGISYGTRLAQTALRDTPNGIRAVILDSSYPLQIDLYRSTPSSAQSAFDALFAACAADAACAAAYPDLGATFWSVVDQLSAEPVMQTITNPLNGESYDALYTGEAFIGMLFQSLYAAELIPLLPGLIVDVSTGDYTIANLINGAFLANIEAISIGQQLAVQCYEEAMLGGDVLDLAEVDPRLQRMLDFSATLSPSGLETLCAAWQTGIAEAVEGEAVSSEIPTLILSGAFDPITPPRYNEIVADAYPDSYFFSVADVGHGVSISNECAMQITIDFLEDPTQEPDSTCLADVAITFNVPVSDTVTLVPFESAVFGMEGVIPEGWAENAPGVYNPPNDNLVAMLQQALPGFNTDSLVGLLESQLGLEFGESTGTFEGESLTFTLYEASVQGLALRVAIAETDSAAYLILLQALPSSIDTLITSVFEPAMTALTPAQ